MVIERNLVKVGNREIKKRYIGNKLIFEDLRDKTEILSGTEIYTDQADDSVAGLVKQLDESTKAVEEAKEQSTMTQQALVELTMMIGGLL